MNLYVIGVNYKSTPIQIREKFSIDKHEYEKILSSIKLLEGVSECALLSTCNRTEVHIFSEDRLPETGCIEAHLCALKDLDIYEVKKYFYVYEGKNAIRHIFKVASGMDSMILGEDQILGQFKNAYEISLKEGTSKGVLNTLSRLAITSSKKIKTRNISLGKAASVAGKVVEFLIDIFDRELSDQHFLIIGSGEVGSIMLEEISGLGADNVYMTKRSRAGAADAFNSNSKAELVCYTDRYLYIDKCDVVISATSSPHYSVTRDMLEKEITDKSKKRIFIDLAVPRDIDETIGQIENTCLHNIDDLQSYTSEKKKNSYQIDFNYIQEQIDSHIDEFVRWFQKRNAFCCKEV